MSAHSRVVNHPNRLPFGGVLSYVDTPSDKPPCGGRTHRVILTRAAAEEAMPSLIGMAVGFKTGWDGHNRRQKCGVITHAEVIGAVIRVVGYLFDCDYPEVAKAIRKHEMGMSYEVVNVHIEDMNAEIWTITQTTFTGAAILLCEKAAYTNTRISLVE